MKAKRLALKIQGEAFVQHFEPLARPAIHRPTNFLTRLKR
jgi:hypothetical protein